MTLPVHKTDTRYTYADYLQWPADERWEIINGVAYNMSPAPYGASQRKHQKAAGRLHRFIDDYLEDAACEVYIAPFDVRLTETPEQDSNTTQDEEVTTIVQPDVSVFCDPEKLDDKGANGAPDWVIEVLSPSTMRKDLTHKKELYERHKVKEYWLVDTTDNVVIVYVYDTVAGHYILQQEYQATETISPTLFPDLKIALARVLTV